MAAHRTCQTPRDHPLLHTPPVEKVTAWGVNHGSAVHDIPFSLFLRGQYIERHPSFNSQFVKANRALVRFGPVHRLAPAFMNAAKK